MQKSKKPEKLVEAEVMTWLNLNGFSCNIVESKGVYSHAAGRYLQGQTDPGMSDIVGNDSIGRACFIELKAKGKRRNVSMAQYTLLSKKIDTFCFAVVVDSASLLSMYYEKYCDFIKSGDFNGSRNYLREVLPQSTMVTDMLADLDKPLFPEET